MKEKLKLEISEILNDSGAYSQIKEAVKDIAGIDVDFDSEKWHEIEETLVNILTEK